MTDVQSIRAAHEKLKSKYNEYFVENQKFAKGIIDKLIVLLNADRSRFKFYPVDGSRNRERAYNISGSMRLMDDTFWHVGFNIHFIKETEGLPLIFAFLFRFKREKGVFKGVISGFGEESVFSENDDLDTCLSGFLAKIEHRLENNLELFLEGEGEKTMGFIIRDLPAGEN